MKIKKITKIEYNGDVFNLRIKDGNDINNNYFANGINVSNCHTAKSKSIDTILSKTFGVAQYRLGMSGTYPPNNSAEYLTIQSLMGPKVITVKPKELMDKGLISEIKINAMILDHREKEFADTVFSIKKSGDGKKAYNLEKEFIQKSLRRKIFFGKLIDKFTSNTLILFNNIAYGEELYNYLRDNLKNKLFYYIDGNTSTEKREIIKKLMDEKSTEPKILVASYGTLSTGVSINAIMNIVFADSSKSYTRILQSIGRGLRLHKDKCKLVLFDIVDRLDKSSDNIIYKHYQFRKEIYKKQEFPLTEIKINI